MAVASKNCIEPQFGHTVEEWTSAVRYTLKRTDDEAEWGNRWSWEKFASQVARLDTVAAPGIEISVKAPGEWSHCPEILSEASSPMPRPWGWAEDRIASSASLASEVETEMKISESAVRHADQGMSLSAGCGL